MPNLERIVVQCIRKASNWGSLERDRLAIHAPFDALPGPQPLRRSGNWLRHRLDDRTSAARCPMQPAWTYVILCRSYGAAPGFGRVSYKDIAPTELVPLP